MRVRLFVHGHMRTSFATVNVNHVSDGQYKDAHDAMHKYELLYLRRINVSTKCRKMLGLVMGEVVVVETVFSLPCHHVASATRTARRVDVIKRKNLLFSISCPGCFCISEAKTIILIAEHLPSSNHPPHDGFERAMRHWGREEGATGI